MRQLLISAAALAFLAAPVLAQPANDPGQVHGKGGFGQDLQRREQGGHGGPTSFTNQPPQGQQPGPNGERPGGRGDRGGRGQQAAPPAPAQTPVATPPNRGDRGNGQGNRDRGNGRYDNNRGGNNFNNHTGFNNPGYGGPRRDYRNFRGYHQTFNASRRYRAPTYRRPAGWYDHRWSFGEFLPSAFWARDYWLSNYTIYDLPPPPYGAVWVRVGNDALLVDEDSGEVISVEYGVFY
jgi:Ni/Co efflux regulator RcnB